MRALFVLVCSGLVATANAGDWRAVQSPQMRGVLIPLYSKKDMSSVANVRIGRVFADHDRKGFFRIGLLPLLVGEEVQIEVLQGRRALNALAGLQQNLDSKQRRVVEWRDVTFTFRAGAGTSVHAGRVRMEKEGRWELLEGVRIQRGTEVTWSKAVLFLSGPKAGWIESGSASMELFEKEAKW